MTDKREIESRVKRIIHDLKNPRDWMFIPKLPVYEGRKLRAYMRPVPAKPTEWASEDPRLIALWRNLHDYGFFTRFEATEENVRSWMEDYYAAADDDIMLMLETPDQAPFGHFGLLNFDFQNRRCEFGRGVRGNADGPQGGMTLAARALFDWAFLSLGMDLVFSEVFADNRSCLAWCHRLHLEVVDRIPLWREEGAGVIKWTKTPLDGAPGNEAVRVEVRREVHLETPR